ncbi:hypothetical protein FAM21834_01595 [Lentilactobacillus parabuchneri]|uniref:hypothetical protein n=1 Tax=Lentilactobacillus parabuchneri TaxID=152331 RepID=UPI000A115525|nr:hypothetical protein [Lentilactobacillus parabuchneri]ORN08824.1 hypothetical protein FAM21834_01595 [Lentilactobacillus parabuchneri]
MDNQKQDVKDVVTNQLAVSAANQIAQLLKNNATVTTLAAQYKQELDKVKKDYDELKVKYDKLNKK